MIFISTHLWDTLVLAVISCTHPTNIGWIKETFIFLRNAGFPLGTKISGERVSGSLMLELTPESNCNKSHFCRVSISTLYQILASQIALLSFPSTCNTGALLTLGLTSDDNRPIFVNKKKLSQLIRWNKGKAQYLLVRKS